MRAELIERAERILTARQRLPEDLPGEFLRPSYNGLGLANVAATPLRWLGSGAAAADGDAPLPPFEVALLGDEELTRCWQAWESAAPINHVLVLLVDGLGYGQLRAHITDGDAPTLGRVVESERTFFAPITTVFPSTTTTALASISTAYAPARHGIMGTTMQMREVGSAVNFITMRPLVAPSGAPYRDSQLNQERLVPGLNVYQRLEAAGVHTEIVNYYDYESSGITRFSSRGSQAFTERYTGYRFSADGLAQCRERLRANAGEGRTFTYMYVPQVDTTAHVYGPLSPSNRAEVAALDFSLGRELLAPLEGRRDTVLLLVADHGHATTSPQTTLWINDHPELAALLAGPITGDGRAAYLSLRPGALDAAVAYLGRRYADSFLALPKEQAVALGLFGPPGVPLSQAADDRTGDLLLLGRANWTVRQQLTSDPRQPGYIGVHAGLSRAEMLIPFLAYRLG